MLSCCRPCKQCSAFSCSSALKASSQGLCRERRVIRAQITTSEETQELEKNARCYEATIFAGKASCILKGERLMTNLTGIRSNLISSPLGAGIAPLQRPQSISSPSWNTTASSLIAPSPTASPPPHSFLCTQHQIDQHGKCHLPVPLPNLGR